MNTVLGSFNSVPLLCQLPRTLRREIWASQSLAFAESVLWGHMRQEWQERRISQMPGAKCTVHGLTHSWKKKGHFPPFGGLCFCSHTPVLVVGWLVGCWRAAAAFVSFRSEGGLSCQRPRVTSSTNSQGDSDHVSCLRKTPYISKEKKGIQSNLGSADNK
jgi:hypothetical protein